MPERLRVEPSRPYLGAASLLARENARSEQEIAEILLFPDPDEREIRLVEIDPNSLPAGEDNSVVPFYFAPDPPDVPFWMAIALILPDEKGKLRLPDGWGGWEDAVSLYP